MKHSNPNTPSTREATQELLASEFDEVFQVGGKSIVDLLKAHFSQDHDDWFYDRVMPYFSEIPLDRWAQADSSFAEYRCMNVVSFFQALRSSAFALSEGHVSPANIDWFTLWLLRLTLGEDAGHSAAAHWLPEFAKRDFEAQLDLFGKVLSSFLSETNSRNFLIRLYAPTLDLRSRATTARGFSDTKQAQTLAARAIAIEDRIDKTIEDYYQGGNTWYVLESDRGIVFVESEQYGKLLHLWSTQEAASTYLESRFAPTDPTLRVAALSNRELELQLPHLHAVAIHAGSVKSASGVAARRWFLAGRSPAELRRNDHRDN